MQEVAVDAAERSVVMDELLIGVAVIGAEGCDETRSVPPQPPEIQLAPAARLDRV